MQGEGKCRMLTMAMPLGHFQSNIFVMQRPAVDQEEVTACTCCLERGKECTPGEGTTKACVQCHQVKGHCSLVQKHPAAPPTPTKACKWPRVGEAGSSRAGEVQEKEVEVADEEGLWGVRVCEGIAHLSSSLEGLTEMIRWQNMILGCLAGMMEEEAMWVAWRQRTQREPVVAPVMAPVVMPVVNLRGDDEGEEEEVEEEARNKGENKEDIE